MTDTDVRRMTVAEIALMREIVRWRRSCEIEYVPNWSRYRTPGMGRSVAWTSLDIPVDQPMIAVTDDLRWKPYHWISVKSFMEAVDVLVALSFLPPRFSSAYRAGWKAAESWHEIDDKYGAGEYAVRVAQD